ncbi:hypothetical protein OAA77_00810 [Gammaproteobacteria bacterium]|nr:hypothetical protein [Gammaproteobacteria bacterium]
MSEQPTSIVINVDGEARSYEIASLSEAAKNKIAGMQFFQNTVSPIVGEVVRLLQLGANADQGQLKELLPEKFEVVQQPESSVESEADNKNGDILVP